MDANAPHVLACRRGEGPPMAPPGWKWITGKRAKDICFVSPSGQRIRSKVSLVRFLANLLNPPAEHEFLWRANPSDFKNVPLPGVEKKCLVRRNIKRSSKEIQNWGKPLKSKSKIRLHQNSQHGNRALLRGESSIAGNSVAKAEADTEQDIVVEIPTSQGLKRKRLLQHKSKVCHFCGPLGHKAGHHWAGYHGVQHHMHGLQVKQKGSKPLNCHTSVSDDERILSNLFKGNKDSQSIANHSASLHEAARVLQAFLVETGELTKIGNIPVGELHKTLLNRQVTRESMKAVPLNVVRAFVLLTRNEAAPSTLGRRALVRLCTKWYCKYKRFWCLLEEHRIDSIIEKFLSNIGSLDESHAAQNKSKARKDQCMVNPFIGGQHVDNHTCADSQPEMSPKPKFSGISEYSDTVVQYGGSCYRNKPCSECQQYQAIKDAFTNFSDNELQTQRGKANKSADRCDNSIGGTKKQNVDLLSSAHNNKGASEEAFFTLRSKSCYSSVNPCNKAARKYEDLLNKESMAMCDQEVSHAITNPEDVNSSDLFDATLGVDTADYEQGRNNFLGNGCLGKNNDNNKVKHGASVEVGNCDCKCCSENVHFCPGCMCYVCCFSIQPDETWSYIKCSCFHIFHLECAIKERIGGVLEEQNIDGEFLCPVCSVKCDLFPFWRERLKNASETESKDTLQKHLKSAIRAMDGTQRKSLKALNCKVLKAYESVTNIPCSDLRQLLVSILEDVKMQKISKKFDGLLNKSFQIKEIKLLEAQKLVNLSQRTAARDSESYQKAQESVATQKELLAQAEENLKKAEAEMQLANQNAKCSSRAAKRARKRLEMLRQHCKPESVTKELVEVQRNLYNQELSELRRIQTIMGNINCCCEESLPELILLLESMEQQSQNVEAARRRMEDMVDLCDSLWQSF